MEFVKMHGIGNDFVMVDGIAQKLEEAALPALSRDACHRKYGIGADGLILVLPSTRADFRMRMFNPDGSESEMCGNGIRCFARYVHDRGLATSRWMSVETGAGILELALNIEEGAVSSVRVDMGRPRLLRREIPMTGPPDEPAIAEPIEAAGQTFAVTAVSMGNPHAVIFVDDAARVALESIGPILETHARFPERTNVHFVQPLSQAEIEVRTWERGAGATLACGTGACASVVAAALNRLTGRAVLAHLPGGDLRIEWGEDSRVFMTGPAEEVFTGVYRR